MNTRGQMKISFGMIVAVILIAIFVAVAFYAIAKFIGLQKNVQIGQFADKFQFDIDKIWKSSQGSQNITYGLPNRIEAVCLVDFDSPERGTYTSRYNELQRAYYGSENLVFYPVGSAEGLDSLIIEHIDLERITETQNPFCVENRKGKVSFIISMDFGESLVSLK